jgi:hypothetical protein
MNVSINSIVDSDNLLEQVGLSVIVDWLKTKRFTCFSEELLANYINFEKSTGTEEFYDLLIDAIEQGKLSLELIVGKMAVKRLMKTAIKS